MVDETAERIATLGGSPVGTPGALVAQRDWDDYSIGRAGTLEHLGALDVVYAGIIEAHRRAIDITEELDPVTQDMLIGQSGRAGAVPLVRPRPPGSAGRIADHRERQHREDGGPARQDTAAAKKS